MHPGVHHRLGRLIPAVVVAVLAVRTARLHVNAIQVYGRHIRNLPLASFFADRRPGLVPAVEWIRGHPPVRVRTVPHETDRYLHERLAEMLYPIPVVGLDAGPLAPGDLLVLPEEVTPPDRALPLVAAGDLRIYGSDG